MKVGNIFTVIVLITLLCVVIEEIAENQQNCSSINDYTITNMKENPSYTMFVASGEVIIPITQPPVYEITFDKCTQVVNEETYSKYKVGDLYER